ncbi:MAG: Wzz/FepE/Etk N-terminal domain-containing protein [Thermoanaerobaculia bacterium]
MTPAQASRRDVEEPAAAFELVDEPEPIHLVDVVNALLRRRWLIVAGVLVVVLGTGLVTMQVTPTFTASAKFLPSKDPDLSSRMSDLVGAGDIGSFEKNATSPFYLELLRSRTFLERIAARKFRSARLGGEADLATLWEVQGANEEERRAKTTEQLAKTLVSKLDTRTGILTTTFSASEPALAADVVNATLGELVRYSQEVRGQRTRQNREFIERQLSESQKRLATAEKGLAEFGRRNVRVVGLPEVEAERDRLKRAVTIQEEVYLTFRKQLELARIEEQEKRASIEVIDRAAVPHRKSSPSMRKNLVVATLLSVALMAGLAIGLEWMSSIDLEEERNRELVRHLKSIRREVSRPFSVPWLRRGPPLPDGARGAK